MAHFDGKKEFEGLCFLLILLKIVIADFRQGMIGKRLDLDPRISSAWNEREDRMAEQDSLTRDQRVEGKREENPWDIENRGGIS